MPIRHMLLFRGTAANFRATTAESFPSYRFWLGSDLSYPFLTRRFMQRRGNEYSHRLHWLATFNCSIAAESRFNRVAAISSAS